MPYLFSYGSNNITQLSQRLKRKILKSEIIPAYIEDYTRIFCFYSSKWNGSVASIYPDKYKLVFGSLIMLNEKELRKLDKFETNYTRKMISVTDNYFNKMNAHVYICNDTKFVKEPSVEYLENIKKNIYESWKIKTKYVPIYIKTKQGIELYKND
jgi:gamma-glutamylcyclotransferase (GGCT)/AIG2-like uncharacterized protein YtfP